jgi:hypothetical protein
MRCGVFGALPSNATFGFNATPGLKEWLANIKLDALYPHFEESGYDDYDYLVGQMRTRKPITDDTLKHEIKIDKPGHRSRILSKLQEDLEILNCNRMTVDPNLSMEMTSKGTACEFCVLM